MKRLLLVSLSVLLFMTAPAQVCSVSITHIINGNQVQYFGSSPDNPASWSWFFNGGSPLTSSMQNPTITYSSTGTFICALSVSGGANSCSPALSSKTDTVTIQSTGIASNSIIKDEMTVVNTKPIQLLIENSITQNVTINLLDLIGKKEATLFSGNLKQGSNILGVEINGFNSGYYFIQLIKRNSTTVKKIYIE